MDKNINWMEFSSLLAGKICHDLISPISATNNGIELLEDMPNDIEVKDLITESAKIAQKKLQFFRLAYGAAQSYGAEIALAMLKKHAEEYFCKENVKLIWDEKMPSTLLLVVGKILYNLLLVAANFMPKGGIIKIIYGFKGELELQLKSDKIVIPDAFKQIFIEKDTLYPLNPWSINYYHLLLLLNQQNMILNANEINNQTILVSYK
ncbi:histidine phosphotransferase family protein [Bartonella sp. DGB1]|uniref:histidine phosphotransferase family protein n=1 Tax=Bartonella sp. DGB1 TaxID=3239807 RepID=UPI0035233D7E